MIRRLALYWHTLRHLRAAQVVHLVYRRLVPTTSVRAVTHVPKVCVPTRVPAFLAPVQPDVDESAVEFIGERRPLDPSSIDWRAASASRLWRYNLHYFDYLHWEAWSKDVKCRLIESWIAENPQGTVDAWEPYTVSLRIVNWIKFFLVEFESREIPPVWLCSLATQLAWLERNVEYHILANHLLKNVKALAIGGLFFADSQFDNARERGLRLTALEADEQVLRDGGHFERSPQYHSIVTEDLLDVVNLCECLGAQDSPGLDVIASAARRAVQFSRDTMAGDDDIALFNDSAFGIAPLPADLVAYGERVLKIETVSGSYPRIRICKPDSGYFGYRDGSDSFLIDCGPVGPDYQPGHAHCDTLSYELCLAGQRIVVDSGVYNYERNEYRRYSRSTAAHNTVRVDGEEQSEVWSAFRVGRRAGPIDTELSQWHEGRLTFQGGHNGYQRLKGRVTHRRTAHLSLSGCWEIDDEIAGKGRHLVENFIHLHPDVKVSQENSKTFSLRAPQNLRLQLEVTSECESTIEQGWYYPEFGVRHGNSVIVLRAQAALPLRMRYAITRR